MLFGIFQQCHKYLVLLVEHNLKVLLLLPASDSSVLRTWSFPEPTCLLVSAKTRSSQWNNPFPDSKILGVPVSRRVCALVYNMASRDKVDVDAFHKGLQYALEKLGKSNLALKEQQYQILKAVVMMKRDVLAVLLISCTAQQQYGETFRSNVFKCNL